jgi:two-component system, NarL family, nitrate/nitrite response regulator NarL
MSLDGSALVMMARKLQDEPITVLLADDHPIVLRGLQDLLSVETDVVLVGACQTGREAIRLIELRHPTVAVLDLRMPDLGGLDVLRAVRARSLSTRVILLTASISPSELHEAVSLGLDGLVLKDAVPDELLDSLHSAAVGEPWMPPVPAAACACQRNTPNDEDGPSLASLTAREREIASLVSQGLPNKVIARQLGLSEGTVKIHLHNIYQKLNLRNRSSLAVFAAANGWGAT